MVRDGVTWLIRSNGSNMGMYVQAYAFIFANFQALDKVTNRNKMPSLPRTPNVWRFMKPVSYPGFFV